MNSRRQVHRGLARARGTIYKSLARLVQWIRHPDILQLIIFAGLVSVPAIWLIMVSQIYKGSVLAFQTIGLGFIVGSVWNSSTIFGALPAIYGSVITTVIALLIAVPVSLGVGLFQSELAPRQLRSSSVFLVEMLAAVPSVVYGLWGIVVLVPFARNFLDPQLKTGLGILPLFSGHSDGYGLLTAGIILSIMVIPYASSVMREVFAAVPRTQREAMIALGATEWETVRKSVIPFARAGVVAAIMLALGRAIGETIAVTLTIGNIPQISASLFSHGYTIPSIIANEFNDAGGLHLSALFALGLILFVITFLMNIFARVLIRQISLKGKRGLVA